VVVAAGTFLATDSAAARAAVRAGIRAMARKLAPSARRVVVLGDPEGLERSPVDCLLSRMTPDRLQGRVHAVEALMSFGGRPLGLLATGYLLDAVGGRATLLLVAAWTLLVALVSTASPSLRRTPDLVPAT